MPPAGAARTEGAKVVRLHRTGLLRVAGLRPVVGRWNVEAGAIVLEVVTARPGPVLSVVAPCGWRVRLGDAVTLQGFEPYWRPRAFGGEPRGLAVLGDGRTPRHLARVCLEADGAAVNSGGRGIEAVRVLHLDDLPGDVRPVGAAAWLKVVTELANGRGE